MKSEKRLKLNIKSEDKKKNCFLIKGKITENVAGCKDIRIYNRNF